MQQGKANRLYSLETRERNGLSVPPGSNIRILIGAGTMKNTMGKIGIVNLCHKDYLDETVEILFQNAVDTVRQTGVELVLAPGMSGILKTGSKRESPLRAGS